MVKWKAGIQVTSRTAHSLLHRRVGSAESTGHWRRRARLSTAPCGSASLPEDRLEDRPVPLNVSHFALTI